MHRQRSLKKGSAFLNGLIWSERSAFGPNDDKIIKKFINKWSADYEIKACYEASFSGYHFQRKMKDWGYHCDVIAPSMIPKAPGAKRKNDFRDAQNLVRNYASGLLSIVQPPSEVDEAVRSLVRCRLAFKESVKKVKQQINGLLLSQGMNWPGNKWTHAHKHWLSQLQLPHEYFHKVLDEYLAHLAYLESRVQHLDKEIEKIAKTETYAPSVTKLRAFKGIGTLTFCILYCRTVSGGAWKRKWLNLPVESRGRSSRTLPSKDFKTVIDYVSLI